MKNLYKFSLPNFVDLAQSWFINNNNLQPVSYQGGHLSTLINYENGHIEDRENLINNSESEPFVKIIKDCVSDIIQNQGKPMITGLWMNQMSSDQFHRQHRHLGCYFAGCYYVNMPKYSSGIKFFDPINQTVVPESGDLLIWPGSILHEVEASKFFGVRQSIAFNVVIASN